MQNLVIVESPTKARTLSKFLGNKYKIEASMGHIRDLPKAELGVDIESGYEPKYIIPRDKKKKANELKKLFDNSSTIYLATDPDREGEAIAWHLSTLINGKGKKTVTNQKVRRVVFHEITEEAIKEAFQNPRDLDIKLVDAQQARRVLDRLVGYKLSPLLWKKVKRGLSAGRVQTVALRLIAEREREIEAFKPIEYWSIDAELEPMGKGENSRFFASLVARNGEKIEISSNKQATEAVSDLENSNYKISKVTKKEVRRFSQAPFTTSTLQQSAGNKLGFTAKRTMMVAQNLYEQGFITYMRTDSVNLSTQAIGMAREYIKQVFGDPYLPAQARIFKSKSKNAQEAHEAIRPTNISLTPEKLSGDNFSKDHKKLYDLIWKRTVASQMSEAVFDQTSVDVEAKPPVPIKSGEGGQNINVYTLRATGSIVKFEGWLKLYGVTQGLEEEAPQKNEESKDEENPGSTKKQVLPELSENENLDLIEVTPEQHFTEPPPRYTESSLIKKLEELGIGRPSTYAPILSTIQERLYVEKEERKFKPTTLGFTVVDFLIKYFPDIFDYAFTASMEDQLDEISRGEREWKASMKQFYEPLEKKLEKTEEVAEKVEIPVETTDKVCPKCGKGLIVRQGRFGKFLACSGFPECKHTESIDDPISAKCPDDGGDIVIRRTRTGKSFYGCKNWPNCKFASWTKPK